ncbi:orf2 [Dermatophagoides farinae]|uniref:Orf2 n=1 Tax=Dermatophagoides farinae TaxID=6954 RepID=A0A9D4NZB1_DERFA|nr:orf2 [Dermatophagoides farinae]
MMTAIMNACIRTGHVPYLWKISTVRIIPKPGKTNYGQTSSFRPIGLLPILGKILESIMAGRIRRSLATNCPMSTNQYGFTSGKSTIHALDQLMCRIDHQQRDGNHVIMASIDIKEKSVIMYMSRKLRLPVLPTIMVDNRRIDYVEQTKILGVTIDRKRDFRPHLHLVIEKTTRIYRQILAMVHRNLGMRPHILKMIYRSVVVPTITYAAAIWKHAIVFKYMWNHLRQFVRPWAQLISGSYRTASFISTTAIADIAPLELEIMYEASVSLARIHGNYKFGDDFIDIDIPDCADNMIDLPPNIVADQLFACTYHHFMTKIVRMRHSIGGCFAVYNGTYHIVTKYYRFPPYCSNLQADLFVILEAVKFAKEKFSSAAAITIINNNIGAIKHILKNDRKETINLARKIMMAMTNNNMTIHWQKVNPTDQIWHDVRKWARDAATSSLEFKFNLMPMSYVKKVERKRLLANWNKIYIEDKYGSNIKQLHPNVDDVRKFAPFVNKWLTMSLTGHGQFGKYLEKIGRRDDANCQCGLSEQSVHHLKFDCPLMNEPRYRFDMARRNCISPIELIKLEVVFYEQIAIRANELNNGIHQYHTPIT